MPGLPRPTLALTLLLAIFAAIGSAFLIARNLAQPLLVLQIDALGRAPGRDHGALLVVSPP